MGSEYPYNAAPQPPQGSYPGYGNPGASQGNYPTNPSTPLGPAGYPGSPYPGNPNAGTPYPGAGYQQQPQPMGYIAPMMPVTPMVQVAPPAAPGSGLAVAGMVCGIVGIVFAVIPYCGTIVAVPLGLLAIVMGALGQKSATHRGQGTAGLVLGIISIVLSLGLYFLVYAAAHHVATGS